MTEDIYDYTVTCNTCFKKFIVQLFEDHEKNLFLVDKKSWYCEECKQAYFDKETSKLLKMQEELGFSDLTGTPKRISWAVKIRSELLNKVDYLRKSLSFEDEEAKEISDKAFNLFMEEWQKETEAKWWVDNRRTNIRDITIRVNELSRDIK